MANIKISQLPAASTITAGSDVLPIVHNSVTEKATPNQVVNKVLEAPGAIGGTTPSTGAFTEVTTEDFTTTGDVSLNGYITANATAAFFNQPRIYDYANTYTYRVRGVSPGLGADVFCFLPVLGGNDYFVFQGHAQTLTNKTISGSSNTLTNIGNASLSNSSITINGTSVSLGGSISVGSGIPYPGSGIPVSTGTSWSTSLTVPSGALVGTLATQELTNKTLTFPQINGGNIAGLSDLEATGNISLPFLTANSTALWLRSPRIYDYVGTTYSYRISGVSPGLSTDVYCFLPALSGNDTFVFRDFAQTLTNKTISGSSNTLSNIANASLTNSTITINGTAVALGGSIVVGGGISYPGAGVAVSTGSAWGTSKEVPSGKLVGDTDTQTLTSKTLTSPTINGGSATSLTTLSVGTGGSVDFPFLNIDTTALWLRNPRIYDPSENNWYRITPSELTDNRYITLPALTGNDTFVFESHTQTLTNKTLTSPVINGFTTVSDANTPSSLNIPVLIKGGSAGVAGDGGGIAFSTSVLSAITDASQAATSIRSLNEFASETNGEQGSLAFYTNRRTGTNTYSGLVERLKIGSAGGIAFSGSYGSAGQVLTSSGSSAAPTWTTPSASSMYITVSGFTQSDINTAITTANLTSGSTVFFPAGTYTVTSTIVCNNINIIGAGLATRIIGSSASLGANNPIFKLSTVCSVSNLYAAFDSKPASASVGQYVVFWLGNSAVQWYGLQRPSFINYVNTGACGTSFYNPDTSATNDTSVFSTTFSNLRVEDFRYRGFDFRSLYRTGNVYSNIYLSTSQSGTAPNVVTATCDCLFSLAGGESESSVHQLNVEWATFTYAAINLDRCWGFTASTIHLEHLTPSTNNLPFVRLNSSCGSIQAFTIYGNYFPNSQDPTATNPSIFQINSVGNYQNGNTTPLTTNYLKISILNLANVYPIASTPKVFTRGTDDGPFYIDIGCYEYAQGADNYYWEAFPTTGNLTFISSGVNSSYGAPIRTFDGATGLRNNNLTTANAGSVSTFTRPTDGSIQQYIVGSTQSGQLVITSGGTPALYSGSDYRLKENIVPIDNGVNSFKSIQPCSYNIIGSTNINYGFVAHELQNVWPDAVIGDKDAVDDDGNPIYQQVAQTKLIPLMAQTIKELIDRIEALEAP